MKRANSLLCGAALSLGATTLISGTAAAEVSANVGLTTDYMFRGLSLSDNGPAVQGGFDWSTDTLYAGVWASSLSTGMEIDLYAGITPTTGPVTWDFSVIGYFYPGADDDAAEFDYAELKGAANLTVTEQFAVGGAVFIAPENFGDTGEAVYIELNVTYSFNDALVVSGAYGNQNIDDPDGPFGVAGEDDYNSWNLGATAAAHGFELDLRYHGNDIDAGSDIELYTYGPASYDDRVVLTISRAL